MPPVFFPLSWTIVHEIDDGRPMSGLTSSQCEEDDVEILILMTGTDDTFNQTVHSRSSYSGDEILFRPRFKQIIDRGDDGVVTIDIDRLSDVEETNAA